MYKRQDFNNPEKGRTIAATQYAAGADVIYQAAGGTGAGVFKEAKDLNEKKNEDEKVWVLGVDLSLIHIFGRSYSATNQVKRIPNMQAWQIVFSQSLRRSLL